MSFQSLSSNHNANCNYNSIFFSFLPASLKPLNRLLANRVAAGTEPGLYVWGRGEGLRWGRAQVCRSCKYRCARQVRDLTAGFACRLASAIHHTGPLPAPSPSPLSHFKTLAPPPNTDSNCIVLPSQVHNKAPSRPYHVWIPPS